MMVALELRGAGYAEADDLNQFSAAHRSRELTAAVPIVSRWLPRMRWPSHRVALAWALAGPHGRPAARLLVDQYLRDDDATVREAIGAVLVRVAGPQVAGLLPALVEIADDQDRPPRERWGVVEAIGKLRTPEALAAAKALMPDPDVGYSALRGFTSGRGRLSESELDAIEQWHAGDRDVARLVARHRERNAGDLA